MISGDVMRLLIQGGHVLDPANHLDTPADVMVSDGKIIAVGKHDKDFQADQVIDARKCIVAPGLVDLAVNCREPGYEHKGTISSESKAAAKGGVTTLCCPPDTQPIIDTPADVELVYQRARSHGHARILVLGALTQQLQGERLSEMAALQQAGCVALTNAKRPIINTNILRHSFEYAATFGITVFLDAFDAYLSEQGCVHEGFVSTRLGLPAIPACAESIAVARALLLQEHTGVRLHFCRISAAGSVDMIRQAKARGQTVSADVAIANCVLTDDAVDGFNALCHVRPPLRSKSDQEALLQGLVDGTIDAICSDHEPHEAGAKLKPFLASEPGIAGVETLLPLALSVAKRCQLRVSDIIAKLTCNPATILQRPHGTLTIGADADIVVFDPEENWQLTQDSMASAGKNTPFVEQPLTGRVCHTIFKPIKWA